MYRSYLTEFIRTIFTSDELEPEYNSTISALKLHSYAIFLTELTVAVKDGLKNRVVV